MTYKDFIVSNFYDIFKHKATYFNGKENTNMDKTVFG